MKVLITGSLGYIGSVLTDYLARQGFDVIGYDTGFFRDCTLYNPPPAKTVFKDARDIEERDLAGMGAVVHLAGISNDPFGNLTSEEVYDPTRAYSLRLAKLCKKLGIRFIFASSCSVYGRRANELSAEDAPPFPQTPYSLNKLQIENDLRDLSAKRFSPIALRLATVFGVSPRIRFDVVINMLVGMALTSGKIVLNSDGSAWRPNIHILDASKAIAAAIDSHYQGGELLVLNAGDDGNNLKIIDIARLVQKQISGSELHFLQKNPSLDNQNLIRDKKVNDGVDARTYKVSFSKIKDYFKGFACDFSVENGIRDMIRQLKKIGLSEAQFKSIGFYRLQRLDDLYKKGLISSKLEWLKKQT